MVHTTPPTSALRLRVITALILAAIVLGVLAMDSTLLWALLMGIFCMTAAWEWSRFDSPVQKPDWLAVGACLCCVLFLAATWFPEPGFLKKLRWFFLFFASVYWVFLAPWQLLRKKTISGVLGRRIIMPILLGATWLSAVLLQDIDRGALIIVVVTTVIADIAAYFIGRRFGRVKLAPTISPGKTREGAIGGVLMAGAWFVLAWAYTEVVTTLLEYLVALLVGMLLGGYAVIGDLLESLLKRQAGVKDSSHLLPGHGGVLDRIDALLPVFPLAMVVGFLFALIQPFT